MAGRENRCSDCPIPQGWEERRRRIEDQAGVIHQAQNNIAQLEICTKRGLDRAHRRIDEERKDWTKRIEEERKEMTEKIEQLDQTTQETILVLRQTVTDIRVDTAKIFAVAATTIILLELLFKYVLKV